MLPLMEEEFVHKKQLLDPKQMLDVYALTQSMPGVIAINSSLLIGYWVAGIMGSLVSVLAVLTPSVIIITALAEIIQRLSSLVLVDYAFTGVRAGVTAIMLVMLIKLGKKVIHSWKELLLAALAFIAVETFGIHPILVILISGILGFVFFRNEETK